MTDGDGEWKAAKGQVYKHYVKSRLAIHTLNTIKSDPFSRAIMQTESRILGAFVQVYERYSVNLPTSCDKKVKVS